MMKRLSSRNLFDRYDAAAVSLMMMSGEWLLGKYHRIKHDND